MAVERRLVAPAGYDPAASPRVASFAAQLDDQRMQLGKQVSKLEVRYLEWQPEPGVNTIGMLLAHLAIAELWWMRLAPYGILPGPEGDRILKDTIGITMAEDGLPLAPEGRHPSSLAGKTQDDYLRMLDAARAVTHRELAAWRDTDLESSYPLRDRIITREWTVYHVLEHFAGHFGQIRLLAHLMMNAGS